MNTIAKEKAFDFSLPKLLECALPTEERGLPRDGVRLLVSDKSDNSITHSQFRNLGSFLQEGDLLIVNASGTLNAALPTTLPNGTEGRVHLSTKLSDKEWLVEVRQVSKNKTIRFHGLNVGQVLKIPGKAVLKITAPYFADNSKKDHLQLWKAQLNISGNVNEYLAQYGQAIKYSDLQHQYPSTYYQTVFANEPGSVEMPSAGRAFTAELVSNLFSKGVQFAPILLHTGISSLEIDERPYPEYFRVTSLTAKLVNQAKRNGQRIIAVGTTAIRAIESAVNDSGKVVAREGMTNLYITPERGLKVVNAMLTGFHEPKASHLLMMQALANQEHLSLAYRAAIKQQYQWHEFGDLHLLL